MSDCQTCGTGAGTITHPSDPDNNISLSARTVYSGINVSWTWPTTNEAAVAQTIVYRGATSNPAAMMELVRVGGSLYFDSLNPIVDTQYFYWIQIVTVNGTRLDKIGPVSATAKVRGQQTLESLTGLIDSGVLSQALKEDIAGINQIGSDLFNEIEDRIAADTVLSGLLQQIQDGVTEAMTYINTEITQRVDGDSAIVTELETIAAANADNLALILQETQARVTADSALASQTTDLYVKTGANTAAIQQEVTVRTNADTALASSISTLSSQVGGVQSSIYEESLARASGDAALASRTTSVESTVNGNSATGQIGLTTQINTVNGKITQIGALYTAKVQVNGLIGGFGIYNDGTIVDAGFDVDRFWIGRTGPDKVKPFIIDSGIVYIDKARIRSADIDTLKIAGNAVTVPSAVFGNGGANGVGTGSNIFIGQISVFMPQDGSMMITANWQSTLGQQGANACMRILDNGGQIASWSDSGIANYRTSHVGTAKINLSAGSHTFSVYVFNDYGGTWDLGTWGVSFLGVMR